MKHRATTLWLAGLLAFPALAGTDAIPAKLVGVWVTSDAVLKGSLLLEGQALYLGADGVGAIVGGPPPIGFKIVAAFDPGTNLLEFDAYEGTRRGPHGTLAYDPVSNTLDSGGTKHAPMTRKLEVFDEATKKALGL